MSKEVEQAETAELKAKLLREASELAARYGDSAAVVAASEQIAALGGEPAWETELQVFNRLNTDLPGTAKELVAQAQTAAEKAAQKGQHFYAAELLKLAKRTAEKAKLPIEAIQQQLDAVEKSRAGGK